ncbi:MAG: hypothetical protein ACR2PY_02060 [Salinispira sp.]
MVISRLRDNLNTVSITRMNDDVKEIFGKNKFLTVFYQRELIDTDETIFPFKIFKLNADDQFNDYLESHMKRENILNMSSTLIYHFRRSLFEIFANAKNHSESISGTFACGKFNPSKKRMNFTVADAGIGIVENVQRYMIKEGLNTRHTIEWVIKWVMEGGNTTKSNQPGGLGLKQIKEFIKTNRGKLQLASQSGFYELSSSDESVRKMDNEFPGTCVNIEINTTDTGNYSLKSELVSSDV